jgi:hypothetical protein
MAIALNRGECQQRWDELAQRLHREQWEALPEIKDTM